MAVAEATPPQLESNPDEIFDFKVSPRARVTPADVIAIATKCSENKATEREACAAVGLKEDTWYRWKARHKNDVRFLRLIARLQESRVSTLIQRIDDASLGKNMKQPDWRAAAWLAQVIDRERYGDQKVIGQQVTVNNTQNNFLFQEAARKIYGSELPAPTPAKQLTEGKKE